MKSDVRLISARAAAKYMGIPYTTLRDWVKRGHVQVVLVPECRRWWFDPADLDVAVERWKLRRACGETRAPEPMLPFDEHSVSLERRSP